MSSEFDSFDESECGSYIESEAKARNMPGRLILGQGEGLLIFCVLSESVEITSYPEWGAYWTPSDFNKGLTAFDEDKELWRYAAQTYPVRAVFVQVYDVYPPPNPIIPDGRAFPGDYIQLTNISIHDRTLPVHTRNAAVSAVQRFTDAFGYPPLVQWWAFTGEELLPPYYGYPTAVAYALAEHLDEQGYLRSPWQQTYYPWPHETDWNTSPEIGSRWLYRLAEMAHFAYGVT